MAESPGGSPDQGDAGRVGDAHVQAIVVAIDQYAEAAMGNRDYFLNKPHSIGSGRSNNSP